VHGKEVVQLTAAWESQLLQSEDARDHTSTGITKYIPGVGMELVAAERETTRGENRDLRDGVPQLEVEEAEPREVLKLLVCGWKLKNQPVPHHIQCLTVARVVW
jgi:hypothetical protein